MILFPSAYIALPLMSLPLIREIFSKTTLSAEILNMLELPLPSMANPFPLMVMDLFTFTPFGVSLSG